MCTITGFFWPALWPALAELLQLRCSSHGLKDTVRVLFANEELVKQYGLPRSQEECGHLLSLTSQDAKEKRRSWLSKVAMVRMLAHAIHAPDQHLCQLCWSA